ncbi:hypothetical protein SARC_00942 [Sphaeroforma arctica JP610]|uniref:Uncharacterized protein n=1 Tax=Sphaeroforma arctica JP610 TaxID=667725 RepID=A0A0L0GD52_9EUKA|nr:hypothetical protein SARC_00942 [Sphaeroforma arctica JP610]KNC86940.1 hypothetical protein SARC_00942 [Sphaeroforma arctica JP610]|eukprot:XP_014160842.1 hypothetical protein SARC_00942 [Sphaeroforma arctica JP610]
MTEQTVNEIHSKVLPRDVNVNTGIGSSACVKARGASLEDMEVDDSDLQASLIMFSPQRSSSCTNIDICTQSESKVSVDRDLRELPTQSWKHVVASPDHGTTEVGGVTRKHTAETSSPVPIYDNADADTSVIMLSPSRSIPKVLMDDSPVLCVQSGTPIGNSDTTGGNNADDSVIVLSPQKPVCSVSSGGSVVLCATGGIADTTLSVVQGGSIKEECEGGDCMVGESIIDVSANTMLRALRKIHTFTSAQSPDKGGVSTGHVDCMEGIVGRPGMCSNSASHSDNSSVAKLGSSRDDSNEHVMKEENLSAKEVSIHERVRSVDGESAIKVEQSVDEQPNSSTQMSVDEKVSPKIEQYVGIKLSPKLEHAEYVLAGLGSGCSGYQNELIGSDNKNSMQMDDVNPDLKTEDDSQVIEGTADKPRVSTDTDGDVEMHGLEVNTEVRQSHTRVRQTVTDVVQKGAGAPQRKTRQSRRANESKSACSIARAKTSTAPAEHGDVEMAEPEVHASNVKSVALKEYAGDYIAPEVDKVEADDTARNTGDMEDTENTGSQIDDTENLDSEIGDAADVSGLDSRGSELADIDSVAGDGDGTATDASEGEVSESAQIDSEIGSEAHPASDMDDIEDIPVELEDIADAARGMDGTENVTTEVGNATNDMSESDDTTHATSNMDDKADIAAVVDDTTNDANELESATGATASGEKIAKKRKIQGVHRVRLRKAAKAVNGAKLVQASNDAQMEEKLRLERLMDRQRRIRIAEQQAKQEELGMRRPV